jgi:predicted nucleotidyltransferase
MKNNLTHIITKLRQELPYIQKEFDVCEIELFGSYLRQEQNSKSDVDLLVTFKKTPGLFKFLKLENYLSDILKIKVDLVLKDSIKPLLKNQILNHTVRV